MSQVKTKFIENNAVSNAKLAQSTALTLKGNNTGSTANTSDLSVSQVNVMLGTVLANGTVPFSADQSMGSNKLINVTDPVGAQDAATKAYVDAGLAALNPATSVYAATAGSNIPGTYLNGVGGIGATFTTTATGTFTVDGTTPPLNARILIKDQSSGLQNGIYTITTLGTIGVQTVFTRALDYDTPSDVNSAGLIPVINGTVNALSSWQQIATITTIGTDALIFTEFTANPSLYLLKANNLNDVASKSASFNNLSPMTTLGDTIYGGASGTGTRLAGNTTTTKNFLVQTGNGSISAAPSWSTIVASDIPSQLNAPLGINVAALAGTALKIQALGDTNAGSLQLLSAANNHAVNFYMANNGFFYINVVDNGNFAIVQTNSGNLGIGGTGSPDNNVSVTVSQSVNQVQLAVRGNATQTHNLQVWENSTQTVLAFVDQNGNFSANSITATGSPINIASGGTNSSTALNNNRIMVSSGGAIVEAAALTNGQLFIGSTGAAPVAANITPGTGISISNGAGSITVNNSFVNATDIATTSFSAANNQSSAANVTGLAFSNSTVRAFQAEVSVTVIATSSLYEFFTINGIQRGADWQITYSSTGDVSGFLFSITNAGQIQYTDSNYSGFTSATLKFRALTLPT